MPKINPSLPVVGQPDSTEEPKIVTALSQLVSAVDNVDSDQIADGTISVADLAAIVQQALIPTGTILATAKAAADAGFLMGDGSAVSRTTYSALFNAIGTTYGAGDGSTTFNLPDLQGRAPVGKGTHSSVAALGNNEGAALANRTPRHHHAATVDVRGANEQGVLGGTTPVATTQLATATKAVATGDGSGSNEAPAYVVVNYQIKT